MMRVSAGPYELEMFNDPTYSPASADNVRTYQHVYDFADGFRPSSRHGICCRDADIIVGSAVALASGGATGIHENSLKVAGPRCYCAVGGYVLCLGLPDLELNWKLEADSATVFGIHFGPNDECLLIHGELEISRITWDGTKVWSSFGADIFTGQFAVLSDHVEATDFEGRTYNIRLSDGEKY